MRKCALALAVLVLLGPGPVTACSVPVFRYALERWKPSPLELVVFHRGPLAEPARAALRPLEDPDKANVTLTLVDLAGKVDPDLQKLWDAQAAKAALPHAVVRFPAAEEKAPPAWAGAPDEKSLAPLLDSPGRQELVRRLSRGESAVFLLLESGDTEADGAVEALLKKELARLEKAIELPAQDEEGFELRSALPLAVRFSILKLSRKAPAESAFVNMLLASDEGLAEAVGPVVFPIFGRGRSLCGLHGQDINAREIDGVARFLCGACSCQVKELNPGVDLLLSADWDALLDAPTPPEPRSTPPAEPPAIPAGLPEPEAPAEEPAAPAPVKGSHPNWLWAGLAAGVVVLLTGAWAMRSRNTPPS